MSDHVKEFSDSTFEEEVLGSEELVLVDFWAPWCGPCRMLAPTIEEIAVDNAGSVKVGKLNTDDNRQAAISHNIQGLPTVLLFKGGEVVETMVGLQPKERLQQSIDKHLS